MGGADEFRMSKDRAALVEVLRKSGRPMTPAQVAPLVEKHKNAVGKLMWSMEQAGQLRNLGSGLYALPVDQR
jgi:predicted transcriptional regulator of viral defense system